VRGPDFEWIDLLPERTRVTWQVPVVFQRASWARWLEDVRTNAATRRAMLRVVGFVYALFGLIFAMGLAQRTAPPGLGVGILMALAPLLVVIVVVLVHAGAGFITSLETVRLKDSRVVVLTLNGPQRVRVRNLTGFVLREEGEWSALYVRSAAGWQGLAMPRTFEAAAVRRWMRERRIRELEPGDVPAERRLDGKP
jgi:hypothetical protein